MIILADVTECSNNPCMYGARCIEMNGSYGCECDMYDNYVIMLADVTECSNNPCMYGARCIEMNGSYRCECAAGYTGINCETGQSTNSNCWYI